MNWKHTECPFVSASLAPSLSVYQLAQSPIQTADCISAICVILWQVSDAPSLCWLCFLATVCLASSFPAQFFSDSVKIPPPQANTPVSDSPCLPFVSCILHCCHRMYHLSEIAQTLSLCCTLESYLRIRTTCFVCVTWNLKKVTTFLRNKLNIWG